MRYSTILLVIIYAAGLAVLTTFAVVGPTSLFDAGTLLRFLLLLFTLMGIVLLARRRPAPLEMLLVTVTLLFFMPPMLAYMLYPDRLPFGGTRGLPPVSVSHVNKSIVYVAIGCVVLVLGIVLGRTVVTGGRRRAPALPLDIAPFHIAVVWIALMAIELVVVLRFGTFSTVLDEGGGGPFLFLIRFIKSDSALYVGLIVATHYWQKYTSSQRKLLAIGAAVAIVYRTFTGTRQIILLMILVTIMALTSLRGDFRIPARVLAAVMLLLPLSLVAFAGATYVRLYWDTSKTAGHYLRPAEFMERAGQQLDEAPATLYEKLFPLFFRVNGLDPVVMIMSTPGVERERFVNPINDLESFINIVTPGTPFLEAREPSKTFLVVYRGYPLAYLDQNYVTTMWTLWGYSYAELGWWGGLAALFLIGIFLAVVYELLSRWHSPYAAFAQLWWLLSTYYLIVSFGFDTDAATSVEIFLPLADTLAVLAVLTWWSRSRRLRRAAVRPRRIAEPRASWS